MESPQDHEAVDDKTQRSLFIRVRNLTPSKSMRSPSRNFMDRWTSKPQTPTATPSAAVKGTKTGLNRFFDKEDAVPEPPPSLANVEESVNLRVFHAVSSWLKENDVLQAPASLTPPTNQSRRSLLHVYDTLFNTIDEQDNQLTNELLELNCHLPRPHDQVALSSNARNRPGNNNSNSLFDAVVVVGPDLTDIMISHDLDAVFDPVVCHTYPSHVVFESLQHFCYPNGVQLISDDGRRPSTNSSETDSDTDAGGDDDNDDDSKFDDEFFVFVLSGGGKEGQDVQYALCRQSWVRVPNHVLLQPHGAVYAPLTYCILVKTPYIPFFRAILHRVMDKHVAELDDHPGLWTDLSTFMTPTHETWLDSKLQALAAMGMVSINSSVQSLFDDHVDPSALQLDHPRVRPSLTSVPTDETSVLLLEWALPIVLTSITMDSLLQAVAALLTEMKVLVVCDDIELLTATVLGLVSLLAPLVWTGPLIAVLPSSLLEYLEAPVPYVIGTRALPIGFVAPPDTFQLFPQSNRVIANVLPLPDADALKADLLAMSLRRDASFTDHIIDRFRAYMQSVLRKCNDRSQPHAFYDSVKATQLYSSYQQRTADIKLSRDGANRHFKLEPQAPVIPRKSIPTVTNRGDDGASSNERLVRSLLHVACHGDSPELDEPTPMDAQPDKLSALAKLRSMCAASAHPAQLTPSVPQHPSSPRKGSKPLAKPATSKRKTSAPLSPRPTPETITLVLRKDASGVSMIKPIAKPATDVPVKEPPPPLCLPASVPPPAHAPLATAKSVRIVDPEQAPSFEDLRLPSPPPVSPTTENDTTNPPEAERSQSATKIQRVYRQWSFKQHHASYQRCNSTPIAPGEAISSTQDASIVNQAKSVFSVGIAVSKLGRHGTWGRRRLRCDTAIDHLMWEKVTGKHRVSGDSMVAFRDITRVEAGVYGGQKPTMMGTLLFANDADDNGLCWTVHTTDPRRRTVVFKVNTTTERDRAMQELQVLVDHLVASAPVSSSRTMGAVDGEMVMLRKFQDELRAGICIRKHGRQGKPHAKYLSCDPLCTQLEWRDPPTGGRGWLKRTSTHQGMGDTKNVISLASIIEIAPTESSSPLRSFMGSAQQHRISIVSSVRTLIISTDAAQDHLRVYHGLKLLVRHYGANGYTG